MHYYRPSWYLDEDGLKNLCHNNNVDENAKPVDPITWDPLEEPILKGILGDEIFDRKAPEKGKGKCYNEDSLRLWNELSKSDPETRHPMMIDPHLLMYDTRREHARLMRRIERASRDRESRFWSTREFEIHLKSLVAIMANKTYDWEQRKEALRYARHLFHVDGERATIELAETYASYEAAAKVAKRLLKKDGVRLDLERESLTDRAKIFYESSTREND